MGRGASATLLAPSAANPFLARAHLATAPAKTSTTPTVDNKENAIATTTTTADVPHPASIATPQTSPPTPEPTATTTAAPTTNLNLNTPPASTPPRRHLYKHPRKHHGPAADQHIPLTPPPSVRASVRKQWPAKSTTTSITPSSTFTTARSRSAPGITNTTTIPTTLTTTMTTTTTTTTTATTTTTTHGTSAIPNNNNHAGRTPVATRAVAAAAAAVDRLGSVTSSAVAGRRDGGAATHAVDFNKRSRGSTCTTDRARHDAHGRADQDPLDATPQPARPGTPAAEWERAMDAKLAQWRFMNLVAVAELQAEERAACAKLVTLTEELEGAMDEVAALTNHLDQVRTASTGRTLTERAGPPLAALVASLQTLSPGHQRSCQGLIRSLDDLLTHDAVAGQDCIATLAREIARFRVAAAQFSSVAQKRGANEICAVALEDLARVVSDEAPGVRKVLCRSVKDVVDVVDANTAHRTGELARRRKSKRSTSSASVSSPSVRTKSRHRRSLSAPVHSSPTIFSVAHVTSK